MRELRGDEADNAAAGGQLQGPGGLARALLALAGIELAGLKLDQEARDIREAPSQREGIALFFQLELQHGP